MHVDASHDYSERILGRSENGQPMQSIRHYEAVQAKIDVDGDSFSPQLRADRRLISAEILDKECQIYSPQGPITRDELDLIDIPANTLLLERLLPRKAIAVGDSWPVANDDLAMLLGIDGVATNDVVVTCGEATAETISLRITGQTHGAIEGVSTDISIEGEIVFDRRRRQVASVSLTIKEDRAVGHVHPGLAVKAELTLEITPLEDASELSDESLKDFKLAEAQDEDRFLLECSAASGHFRFHHDRRWHLMGDEPDSLALRLVDRGELIAQCNVSPLPRVEAFTPLERFQEDVRLTLGKSFGQFVECQEGTIQGGRRVCRVVVSGEAEGTPIRWHYYLIQDEAGRSAALSFTAEESLFERLAEADEPIVATFELLDASKSSARIVTPAEILR